MKITRQAFESAVRSNIDGGMTEILAIYTTLDLFLEEMVRVSEVKLKCRKGCSFCCLQLVNVTKLEMDAIISFLQKNRSLRRAWEVRMRRTGLLKRWAEYSKREGLFQGKVQFSTEEILGVHKDWMGHPCPFLTKAGECDIYPVRPIDCRTMSSTTLCSQDESGIKRFRFEPETWANEMVLELGARVMRFMGITPLHHYLLEWQKAGGNWTFGGACLRL